MRSNHVLLAAKNKLAWLRPRIMNLDQREVALQSSDEPLQSIPIMLRLQPFPNVAVFPGRELDDRVLPRVLSNDANDRFKVHSSLEYQVVN